MGSLAGQVALVIGGGEGIGKAVALSLAAQGIAVVVSGKDERALAETVGEIACGAGKARHVAGDVDAAVAKAIEAFGRLDVVVVSEGEARVGFASAASRMTGPGRFIALGGARIDGISCESVEGADPATVAARVVALVRSEP